MITAPHTTYTTSDLRRAEVIDEAFSQPVSVRDGKTGDLLLMVPQALINRSNEVARYTQLFTRVVVECQRPDPSSVALDRASYIVDFTPAQRQQFVREFAEALSSSLTEDDPAAVEAFIAYMSHANNAVPPQFHSSFLDGERDLLDAHLLSRR
jgi:hypothetical protein